MCSPTIRTWWRRGISSQSNLKTWIFYTSNLNCYLGHGVSKEVERFALSQQIVNGSQLFNQFVITLYDVGRQRFNWRDPAETFVVVGFCAEEEFEILKVVKLITKNRKFSLLCTNSGYSSRQPCPAQTTQLQTPSTNGRFYNGNDDLPAKITTHRCSISRLSLYVWPLKTAKNKYKWNRNLLFLFNQNRRLSPQKILLEGGRVDIDLKMKVK